MAEETADVKTDNAATDTATAEGSSATAVSFAAKEETQGQADEQAQTSPGNQSSEGAGDSQASETKATDQQEPETKVEDKSAAKSRTARRIEHLRQETHAEREKREAAEKRATLAETALQQLQSVQSGQAQQAQTSQQAQQVPPEQTSKFWARKWHEANSSGTATPEQLQEYAAHYERLDKQERERDMETVVQRQLQTYAVRARHESLLESELESVNQVVPFRKDGQLLRDSPVLTLAYAKSQQKGVPIQTKADLAYFLKDALCDLLLTGAVSQRSEAAQLRQRTQEMMSRTALESGGQGRGPAKPNPIENLTGYDLKMAAAQQLRSGKG